VIGRESDHPPSYAAEVNAWSFFTTAPYVFILLWLVKHSDNRINEDCSHQGLTHGINPSIMRTSDLPVPVPQF
jgi:hypothetical protein